MQVNQSRMRARKEKVVGTTEAERERKRRKEGFRVTHIKLRCRLPADASPQHKVARAIIRHKGHISCSNIAVLRREGYTFVVFGSRVLNICGIRCETNIPHAIRIAADTFEVCADSLHPVCDNVTSSGHFSLPPNFSCENYAEHAIVRHCVRIELNRQRLSAVRLVFDRGGGGGVALLFRSGRYNVLGGASVERNASIHDALADSLSNLAI